MVGKNFAGGGGTRDTHKGRDAAHFDLGFHSANQQFNGQMPNDPTSVASIAKTGMNPPSQLNDRIKASLGGLDEGGALMTEESLSQRPNLVVLVSIAAIVLLIFAWSFAQ